jgi:hypothetical protein
MKIILSVVLGIYSMAMATYAVSEMYSVYGDCTAGCFKDEQAFGSGSPRNVNVQYKTSGDVAFPVTQQSKVGNALGTALNNWNIATDNTNTTSPYSFQNNQGSGTPNVEIIFVNDIKDKDGKEICAQTKIDFVPGTRQVRNATISLKKNLVENSSQQDLAEIIQHEIGHFMGLADFYGKNPDQCETTMAQAESGCAAGLKGSQKISKNDVANVKNYVSNTSQCKQTREKVNSVTGGGGGGGGFTDPNPAPIFYPRTCYYYYDAVDLYWCYDGCSYVATVYYLTDVICNY